MAFPGLRILHYSYFRPYHLIMFGCTLRHPHTISYLRQEPIPAVDNKWHYLVEPYIMFPNMKGTTGIGELPEVEVDENPGDIFSNLQFGAMRYLEAYNNRWAISSDLMYMDLSEDIQPNTVIIRGEYGTSAVMWAALAWALRFPHKSRPTPVTVFQNASI